MTQTKQSQERKFLILVGLLKRKIIMLNAKVGEIESKIPSISGLATTSGLTVVENKIPGCQ